MPRTDWTSYCLRQRWRKRVLNKIKGRLPFIQHVKYVSFKCENDDAEQSEFEISVRDAILDAVKSGMIRSLRIQDNNSAVSTILVPTIIYSHSLTQLVFGSCGPMADLPSLRHCVNLRDLYMKWDDDDWNDDTAYFLTFMQCLPDQLKRLRIRVDQELTDALEEELGLAFESNTILPYLEEFMSFFSDGFARSSYYAAELCGTIMVQTNQVRPIKCASVWIATLDVLELCPLPFLSQVAFQVWKLRDDWVSHIFSCVPSLTKLEMQMHGKPNFTPVLQHLPHQSLVELSLWQLQGEPGDLPHVLWTDISVQELAKLTRLTSLSTVLDIEMKSPLFDGSCDLSSHLPITSWPALVKLCIQHAWLTVSQLAGILRAAPALLSIEFKATVPRDESDDDDLLYQPGEPPKFSFVLFSIRA